MSGRIKHVISMMISLLCGLFIYILFRPQTYISKLVFEFIPFKWNEIDYDNAIVSFLGFYFADFLWCFSLASGLCFVLFKDSHSVVICCLIAFVCGVFWEIGQMIHLFGGTADILDVLMYLLAACTRYIFNIKEKRYEKD